MTTEQTRLIEDDEQEAAVVALAGMNALNRFLTEFYGQLPHGKQLNELTDLARRFEKHVAIMLARRAGRPAPLTWVQRTARKNEKLVDALKAIGAMYDGRQCGSMAEVAALAFDMQCVAKQAVEAWGVPKHGQEA